MFLEKHLICAKLSVFKIKVENTQNVVLSDVLKKKIETPINTPKYLEILLEGNATHFLPNACSLCSTNDREEY